MDDTALRQDILEELEFEPDIRGSDLGIAVENGAVTISGHLPSLAAKAAVLGLVEAIRGVRAIAEEIEVRPPVSHLAVSDDELARRVVDTLRWNTALPTETIHATVIRGRVELRGEVQWHYQRRAAEDAVRRLHGLLAVDSLLKVAPSSPHEDLCERIHGALRRNADVDASGIGVVVKDGVVILDGKLRHLAERRCVERAVWAAPGVAHVVDRMTIA